MDADDGVPVLDGHVEDHPVAQDARVVDHDVQIAVLVDGRIDDPLGAVEVGDVVAVGDGLATRGADLVDDLAGRAARRAGAVELGADVVDDHVCALAGERQRVLAAEPASRARHDGHATFTDSCHSLKRPPAGAQYSWPHST